MKTILNYNDFLNESIHSKLLEANGQYTQKEILGYNTGLKAPDKSLFKVGVMVTGNKSYDSQELLNQEMGRVTEVSDKITYKKGDGKLYTSTPDDLIIITGINESNEYTTQDEELLESKLQDDYREFFRHLLDLYEVKSPSSIKDEKCKKDFFNKVNKGWVKGQGLSEYGKKLMDCECLDENGDCCDKKDDE